MQRPNIKNLERKNFLEKSQENHGNIVWKNLEGDNGLKLTLKALEAQKQNINSNSMEGQYMCPAIGRQKA